MWQYSTLRIPFHLEKGHRKNIYINSCATKQFSIELVNQFLNVLKLPAARPVDELRSSRCRESSKCKVFIPFYCSSLATPAARLVDELKSSRYGECAR